MDSILDNEIQPLPTKTILENRCKIIYPQIVERINKGHWTGIIETPFNYGDMIPLLKHTINQQLSKTQEYKLQSFCDGWTPSSIFYSIELGDANTHNATSHDSGSVKVTK